MPSTQFNNSADGVCRTHQYRISRPILASILTWTLITAVLLVDNTPARAEHECYEPYCSTVFHGFTSRNKTDLTPNRYDEIGNYSWYSSTAANTSTYHYTYATGGRELDNHAVWDFAGPIRGVYEVLVRVPEGDSLSRPPTASVLYDIYIQENGQDQHAASFMIDQRRQRGWVASNRVLVLRSPERIRVTASDRSSWPDHSQAGLANSRLAVDAIRLRHIQFLDEDRTYAQMHCAARTAQGREIGLFADIDHIRPTKYGSLALSAGAGIAGLIPAIALNPIGIGVLLSVAIGDSLASLILGEGFWDSLATKAAIDRQFDVGSVIRGAKFGGTWDRPDRWLSKRYFHFGEPGPCELARNWLQYLPRGA